MKISDFIIALFIICTSALVSILATMSMAQGIQGMGYVLTGCIACFVGGWIIVAKELS
jgi:hypothetical protein